MPTLIEFPGGGGTTYRRSLLTLPWDFSAQGGVYLLATS
jgi:hypothetical protein